MVYPLPDVPTQMARQRLRDALLQTADLAISADVLTLDVKVKRLKQALGQVKFSERYENKD